MVDPGRPTHCYCTWRVVCRWEQQCQSSDSPPPFSGWCSLWQGPSTLPATVNHSKFTWGKVFWTSSYYTGYWYFIKIVLGEKFVYCSAQYHAILKLIYLLHCNKPLKKICKGVNTKSGGNLINWSFKPDTQRNVLLMNTITTPYTSVLGLDRDQDRNPDPGRPKQFPKGEKKLRIFKFEELTGGLEAYVGLCKIFTFTTVCKCFRRFCLLQLILNRYHTRITLCIFWWHYWIWQKNFVFANIGTFCKLCRQTRTVGNGSVPLTSACSTCQREKV